MNADDLSPLDDYREALEAIRDRADTIFSCGRAWTLDYLLRSIRELRDLAALALHEGDCDEC